MAVSANGTVFVQLNKGHYSPGEQVNGMVFLNVVNNYPGGSAVWIFLSGAEHTSLVEAKTRKIYEDDIEGNRWSKDETYYVPHQERNSFFNHGFPIHQFDTPYVPVGQYSFPFCFVLPRGLPSTFNYEFSDHGDCFGRVNYTITAQVKTFENFSAAGPIMCVQPFTVNQELLETSGPQRKEIEKEIVSWCCCNKGNTKIISYFEKNDYVPGEDAYMITEVDNSQCNVNIDSIRAAFRQRLTLQAEGYTEKIVLDRQVVSINGIPSNTTMLRENAKRIAVPLKSKSGLVIQPTCRGRLVGNEHVLRIELKMDACTCWELDPSCELGLNLRNPDMNYSPWNARPANWDPQVFNTYKAQLSPEFSQPGYPDPYQQQTPGQISYGDDIQKIVSMQMYANNQAKVGQHPSFYEMQRLAPYQQGSPLMQTGAPMGTGYPPFRPN